MHIDTAQQQSLVNMKEVIHEVAEALQAYSEGQTQNPIRYALDFNQENRYLVMPALSDTLQVAGVKVVSVVPQNTKQGKPAINGTVILTDYDTGETLATLDAAYLTKIRTGAISGVATQYFAKQDATTLSVIGTGAQAEGLIEAVLAVRPIKRLLLFNLTYKKAKWFAQNMEKQHPELEVTVFKDVNDVLEDTDIIVTATNASDPVFEGALKPGVHLNAVGSFKPEMQELPTALISEADKVIVEAKEAALEETGDLLKPIQQGAFSAEALHGELGRVVSGVLPGRETEQEVTVFKSVGLAIVDIVVANYIYNKLIDQ